MQIGSSLVPHWRGAPRWISIILIGWATLVLYSGFSSPAILEETALGAAIGGGLALGAHWLDSRLRRAWAGYVFAVVAAMVNTAMYYWVKPTMHDMEFLFALGVIGISVRWGLGPGLVSAILASTGYSFVETRADGVSFTQIWMQGVFLALAALVVALIAEARERTLVQLEQTYVSTLSALAAALDARDRETGGHSERVAALTLRLARQMGVSESQLRYIHWGAIIHDVGKIGVSDAILRKPAALTQSEWAEMRKHPEIGYNMLKDIPFLRPALDIVRYHHERYDGKGYPLGLAGETIPLAARIFAVVDAFDAMTSDRPYRKARLHDDALTEIRQLAGKQFDPRVVQTFMRVLEVNK